MSKSTSWLLLYLALVSGCVKSADPVCMAPGHIDDGTCTTAILNIIASPESYEGKRVSVLGFVDVVSDAKQESVFLYPSRDAMAMQATTAAIRVVAEGRQLELIRGRYRVGAPAHATGIFRRAAGKGILGEIEARETTVRSH